MVQSLFAQQGQPGGGGLFADPGTMMLWMVGMFFLMYLIVLRPMSKKQQREQEGTHAGPGFHGVCGAADGVPVAETPQVWSAPILVLRRSTSWQPPRDHCVLVAQGAALAAAAWCRRATGMPSCHFRAAHGTPAVPPHRRWR